VKNNEVINTSSAEVYWITGGYTSDGTVSNNIVTSNGGRVIHIYGGEGKTVQDNIVNIQQGDISFVYGGKTSSGGVVSNNIVNISDGDASYLGGAAIQYGGTATNNTVNVSGGYIYYDVYGVNELTTGDIIAENNTINYTGGTISGNIYGYKSAVKHSGNTLNVGAIGLSAKNIINLDNLNFASLSDSNVALSLTDTTDLTDLTNTTITVNGLADGYKAYINNTSNKYYLLKGETQISVDDAWLKSTQSSGDTLNITSKTEYDVTQGGIFQSTDKKALYIASNSSITNAISNDGIFDDRETGVADGITINLNNGADYGDLAINLSKQTKINLANAKNVGAINANNSDITITDSTLNGNTSANSLNLSGAINANNYIVANDDIVLNPNTNLTINDDLRSYYGDIHFSNAKANISGDIWANVVNFGDSSNAMSLGSITANDINAQEINFYLPNSANYNSTALQLTTTGDTDLSSTKVSAFLSDASNLNGNGAIHLIQTNGKLIAPSGADTSGAVVNIAGLINIQANIELDTNQKNLDLIFSGSSSSTGNSKILLENKLSQSVAINEASNLLLSNLDNISNLSNANSLNNDTQAGKAVAFGFVNAGSKDYETGSHIEVRGFNASAGIAWADNMPSGDLTTALFVEYGKGKFESFLDNGVTGDGDTEFIGGGAFGKFKFINSFYTE
ncbi:MAG: hypothetical protein J6T36_02455, partial [Campylobacter sp.]|nr:hypothetical protein [Campylobacter sp.]